MFFAYMETVLSMLVIPEFFKNSAASVEIILSASTLNVLPIFVTYAGIA